MIVVVDKYLNISLLILSITSIVLSLLATFNLGNLIFFKFIFQAFISLQILTVFFGVKFKSLEKLKINIYFRYFSFFLMFLIGALTALFILNIVEFGFLSSINLFYQFFTILLIIVSLIIVLPIHVKLVK